MTLTPNQRASFENAARPLIQWLNENTCPHAKVIVTVTDAELVSGENVYETFDFVPD